MDEAHPQLGPDALPSPIPDALPDALPVSVSRGYEVRTGKSFKKIKGSNPRQVRQQFLQHVMGADRDEAEHRASSAKLRPVKDVLKKLKYDDRFEIEDYVVGSIERRKGIVEKKVTDWKEYDQEELVAYIRNVVKDDIVWDRARKLDWIFNDRPPDEPSSKDIRKSLDAVVDITAVD